jgi:hypothetical protein
MSGEATANLKSGGITMCNNNGICNCFSGNNWWWIIILILLLCNCGGGCGNSGCATPWNNCDNNCGCC